MSDFLKHECGIALVRLLKPIQYYIEKYKTPLYGFNKLFLLMEKQHNRGQDGAGIGCVKLGMPAGESYMFRSRSMETNSLTQLFRENISRYKDLASKGLIFSDDGDSIKNTWDFGGEVLLGHLRYATSGNCSLKSCHPYVRRSNWPTRNLMLAGNFTMTNIHQLNKNLIQRGQHPIFDTDTQTILEHIGFQLDFEHERIYKKVKLEGKSGDEIPPIISEELNIVEILKNASKEWDGGYVIAGLIGNGDAFVMRDPNGIRPVFYYHDDEMLVVTSERVPLMTILNAPVESIHEVRPGHVLVLKNNGMINHECYKTPGKLTSCSFERIYFSRGNDPDIYCERKAMGAALAEEILENVNHDLKNTIFGYIPNTAESAYYGIMDKLRRIRRKVVKHKILEAHENGTLDGDLIDQLIMSDWPRREKIAIKDVKLRTFISQEDNRLYLASHIYDITYGVVGPEDNLVCIDDSIVRGTTLKQSILKILSRTHPKKMLIASSAPQIRYPDCYGIDMSELGKFIAFQATIQLLKENNQEDLIDTVYEDCKCQLEKTPEEMVNHVKRLYACFSVEEISKKIAEIVYPTGENWNGELVILYQDVEKLHECFTIPCGDWYFTGNYPTPGGNVVVNKAFINFYEKRNERSY